MKSWLRNENILGHRVYFLKKEDGWIRYFIDSKKNYTGDSINKKSALKDVKELILHKEGVKNENR